jgi:hypothetical protein
MTIYENNNVVPLYNPPCKEDINKFINDVQKTFENNTKRKRESGEYGNRIYDDYDNPERDNKVAKVVNVDYRDIRNEYNMGYEKFPLHR